MEGEGSGEQSAWGVGGICMDLQVSQRDSQVAIWGQSVLGRGDMRDHIREVRVTFFPVRSAFRNNKSSASHQTPENGA